MPKATRENLAEQAKREADAEFTRRYVQALQERVTTLTQAIANHKRRVVIDPQPWDRDLWEVLE